MHFPQGLNLSHHLDRPIFTATKNGKFTLKGAYYAILSEHETSFTSPMMRSLVKRTWHCKGLLPKVRIFLWKVVRAILPVDQIFVNRMRKQQQGCPICGYHSEDVVHALFKCQQARCIWLSSSMGIRTDSLPENIVQLMGELTTAVDDHVFTKLANILWYYWKDRCTQVYEGKTVKWHQVLAQALGLEKLMSLAQLTMSTPTIQGDEDITNSDYVCYVDGSWAFSPLHAEVLAVKAAVNAIKLGNFMPCIIFTDCRILQAVITGLETVDSVEWKAYRDMLDVLSLISECQNVSCKFIQREGNLLADGLAKHAREKESPSAPARDSPAQPTNRPI
ncbi:Ribonuclease H-like superfamily protein [Rhynchospora pubera]|uniref:Ribonuclease H-like superfamily protein n=1 Tax=Rhynchospora pubera TaxID=906938 RepID=A0AAV8GXI5_9POAL|nr:Ribonuclease H-like superfamily protein [Rhynchospora pubera]